MTIVVKMGGSLYDVPNLAAGLRRWLASLDARRVLLVPGGGATADLVRAWDRRHRVGEERSHWLALRALTLNAHWLSDLLELPVISCPKEFGGEQAIVDAYAFAREDETRPGRLPHTWTATSDSLAARVAEITQARRLVLLKSVSLPEGVDWPSAARLGIVDGWFAALAVRLPATDIGVVNFRSLHEKETR